MMRDDGKFVLGAETEDEALANPSLPMIGSLFPRGGQLSEVVGLRVEPLSGAKDIWLVEATYRAVGSKDTQGDSQEGHEAQLQ